MVRSLILLTMCAAAATACYRRPSAISRDGVIATSAPPVREDPFYGRTITASTHYARMAEPRDAPPFDVRAAREAFANVDLAPCRAAGVPKGEGHARVTFAPDGRVLKIVVDAPVGLPNDARACVHRAFAGLTVAEFAGQAVTLGTTWRVR